MLRQIIHIDAAKCNGCGKCAAACHEGAIGMVNGKAKLLRDDYCDGLGDCLPECPTGAITFEKREAAAYDEAAVRAHKLKQFETAHAHRESGCPGSKIREMNRRTAAGATPAVNTAVPSQLRQWPCQIKLVPITAPFYENANLLIAADCTAYAYADFHAEFMQNKITLIGCPKLDSVDYSEKLAEIIRQNDIHSLTVLRMEVPCCGGLETAAKKALAQSGKHLPLQVVTISVEGNLLG